MYIEVARNAILLRKIHHHNNVGLSEWIVENILLLYNENNKGDLNHESINPR